MYNNKNELKILKILNKTTITSFGISQKTYLEGLNTHTIPKQNKKSINPKSINPINIYFGLFFLKIISDIILNLFISIFN